MTTFSSSDVQQGCAMPPKSRMELVVIDATTGNVLQPDNLFCCLDTAATIDEAERDDSFAHELAVTKGAYISPELMRVMIKARRERVLSYDDFMAIFDALHISIRNSARNPDGTFTFVLRAQTQHTV